MTVETPTKEVTVSGNDSATTFSFSDLVIYDNTQLTVTHVVVATGVETTLVLTTDYTVTVAAYPGTGSISFPAGGSAFSTLATGENLVIKRVMPLEQATNLENQGGYFPETQEAMADKSTMIALQQQEELDRAIKVPLTNTTITNAEISGLLPANGYVVVNGDGDGFTTTGNSAAQWLAGDGTVSLPFYSFAADTDNGIYRIGTNNVGMALGGAKVVDYATTGVSVTGTLAATGAVTGAAGTFSGILKTDDVTDATSGTDGSLQTDGGLSVAKAAYVGTTAKIMGVTTHGGDVVSDTDSTDSLGTTDVRWLKAWVDSIQTTADIDVGADLIVAGNLTVNGTTTTVDSTNTVVKDPLMELNTGAASNANDLGLVLERGSTGDNAFMGWDESADKFAFGTTTATGSSTGNITYTDAQILAEGLTLSGTSSDLGTVTTVAISGGTVDNAIIGGSTPAAGTFTTVEHSGTVRGQDAAGPSIQNEAASATNPTFVPNKVDTDTGLGWNTTDVGSLVAGGAEVMSFGAAGITLATGASVTAILDEDNMATDSATALATQQSIKAYVATALGGNPMTTQGDIIRGAASGALERLAAGTANQVLAHDATDASWVTFESRDITWTGAQRATVTALTSTSNAIAINFDDSNDFSHTMTENTTLSAPTGTQVAGQSGSIFITQHASSPKTLAFNAEYLSAGGTDPVITATNGAKDRIDYVIRADGVIEITAVLALA
jgi:hypothetical protein